jgi:endosialidase-like protein
MRILNSTLRAKAVLTVSTIGLFWSHAALSATSYWPPGTTATTSAISTDAFGTTVNAPNALGSIYFKGAGTGESNGSFSAILDPDGNFRAQGSVVAEGYDSTAPDGAGVYGAGAIGVGGFSLGGHGVKGTTAAAWPAAGVYGTSTASNGVGVMGSVSASGSTGVDGEAAGTNSEGVFGKGDYAGVQGFSTASGGFGTSGVASGANGHAIDGACTGSCAGSGYAGYFNGNLWTTGMYGGSDIRLKRDIADSKYGLEQVMKMRPVTFKWKEGGDQTQVGLIAQEVQKLVPELVRAGDQGMLGINYNGLGPVLIKAIQEQQKMIEAQQAQIARLERGRAPLISYVVPGSLGGLALGLVPLGLVAARRKRANQS